MRLYSYFLALCLLGCLGNGSLSFKRVSFPDGRPRLLINGKPFPGLIMEYYSASEKASAIFSKKDINVWEMDISEPNDWEEVDGKINMVLRGNPKALLLLRIGLPLYPYDEAHLPDIATSEDGTKWGFMGGKARWFSLGEITERTAPPGKWTKISFDISSIDRSGVCRPWELVIWHNEQRIPLGEKLRFYLDDIEYYSSKNPEKRFTVSDMEAGEGIYDQELYPRPPIYTSKIVHSGGKALVWEHIQDGKHDGLIYKGSEPPLDLGDYDKLSLWIYPDSEGPFRIEVRICGGLRKLGYPSLASQRWLRDCQDVIKKLINHIKNMPYYDNILGFTLAGGLTAEWAWAGAGADCGVDFSESAKVAWQKFLKERYGALENLKREWGLKREKYKDFSDIEVPGKAIRYAQPELGDFFSPAEHRMFIDYNEFIATKVADDIISLAELVKRESNNKLLVGVLFGYLGGYGDMIGKQAQQVGHAMPEKVIQSPYVDYIAAPLMYWDRKLGGPSMWWLPIDSLQAHGKIAINEADSYSFLHEGSLSYGIQNLWDSQQVLRRDAAAAIAKGMFEWHFFGNLGDEKMFEKAPALVEELTKLNKMMEQSLATDRSSLSEVAVVVDRHSLLCLHPNSYLPGFIYYQLPELARMGAPFDIYLLSDLETVAQRPYKLIVFLNAYWLDSQQRKAIDKLKNKNRTLLFLYACGLVNEKKVDTKNISNLTGISIDAKAVNAPLEISVVDTSHPITKGLPIGFTFGCRARELATPQWYPEKPIISPVLFANDSKAKGLGTLIGFNKCGFAVKEFPHWRSIWVGANVLPARLLRNICRYAGVHIYDYDEDIVYVNRSWLAIHLAKSGEKRIFLKDKKIVISALDGKIIGRGISSFSLKGRKGDTFIFKIDDIKLRR